MTNKQIGQDHSMIYNYTDEERLLWILKYSLDTEFEDADEQQTRDLILSQILYLKLTGKTL
jgi:hypothetical protein